jgi:hypothetical protein
MSNPEEYEAMLRTCPRCGRPLSQSPDDGIGLLCVHCGRAFDAFGNELDIDEIAPLSLVAEIQDSFQQFVHRLFDAAIEQLDPPSESGGFRNLIHGLHPNRWNGDLGDLETILALTLVRRSMRRHPTTSVATEESAGDPTNMFQMFLTPLFVRSFIADCEDIWNEIPAIDREVIKQRLLAESSASASVPVADATSDLALARLMSRLGRSR